MALKKYNEMRDFAKTTEPRGAVEKAPAGARRFVIQKHEASHLHYDFRLELGGTLKSWAVPKGPPFAKGEKRLAMEVEDHPMGYNSFEGTIPKGQYGGGTVMLWDRGTYSPDEVDGAESAEDAVRRGLRSGKLAFTFHGERLRGSCYTVATGAIRMARGVRLDLRRNIHRHPTHAEADERVIVARFARSYIIRSQLSLRRWVDPRPLYAPGNQNFT